MTCYKNTINLCIIGLIIILLLRVTTKKTKNSKPLIESFYEYMFNLKDKFTNVDKDNLKNIQNKKRFILNKNCSYHTDEVLYTPEDTQIIEDGRLKDNISYNTTNTIYDDTELLEENMNNYDRNNLAKYADFRSATNQTSHGIDPVDKINTVRLMQGNSLDIQGKRIKDIFNQVVEK